MYVTRPSHVTTSNKWLVLPRVKQLILPDHNMEKIIPTKHVSHVFHIATAYTKRLHGPTTGSAWSVNVYKQCATVMVTVKMSVMVIVKMSLMHLGAEMESCSRPSFK